MNQKQMRFADMRMNENEKRINCTNCGGGHNIALNSFVSARIRERWRLRYYNAVVNRHKSIFCLLDTMRSSSAYTLSFSIKFIFGNRILQMSSLMPLFRFSFHLSCHFHCTQFIRQAQRPLGLCT